MTDLADLIVSIKDLDRENYHTTANYKHLSDSVPNWQTLVSQQKNWDAIAEVGPYCSTQLCEVLLIGSGLELAERWLHSDVAAQRDAAESWFLNNVDKSMWKEFNRDIKTRLLAKSFRCWPGEPLRTIEEYGTLFRFGEFSRIPPLPHFGGYVPDPQVEKLRFIIEDAGDETIWRDLIK